MSDMRYVWNDFPIFTFCIAMVRYCLLSKIYIDIYSVLKSTFVLLFLPRRTLVNIIMNIVEGFIEDVNLHHNLLQLIPIE